MRVAVDTQGGDHAPSALVAGALLASERYRIGLTLLGHPDEIEAELARGHRPAGLDIVAADRRPDDASTLRAPGSAAAKGAQLVRAGAADALVSAADTAVVLAASLRWIGRLTGAHRPAIAAAVPTPDAYVLVLDVGANASCQPDHLVEFATMGRAFAATCMSVDRPRIGLLNIGHEESKGNELVQAAHRSLTERGFPGYVGFAEPYALASGDVDVLVADGFSGNILVKSMETASSMFATGLRSAFAASWRSRLGYVLARSGVNAVRAKADPGQYGGAALLGINGVVIAAHSGADPEAVCSAVRQARDAHAGCMLERMARGLGGTPETRVRRSGDPFERTQG